VCYPVGPRRGVTHSTGPVRATTRPVGLPASFRDGLLPSPSAGVDPCWSIILGLLGHGVVLSAQDVVVFWKYYLNFRHVAQNLLVLIWIGGITLVVN